MTVFYERCPRGAEFRVEENDCSVATGALVTWRMVHKHEMPKQEPGTDNRTDPGDVTTSIHGGGRVDTGLGFIPPSAIEIWGKETV